MPPPSKRLRTTDLEKSVNDELESFQKEIRRIKGLTTDENQSATASGIKIEHDYEMRVEDPTDLKENEDIKKYIREQIHASERRIQTQLNRIEQKINRLLEEKVVPAENNELGVEEEHLVDWCETDSKVESVDMSELDSRLFPINDDATFDWFFERLQTEEYRNALIERRWQLTRNLSQKSFNIAVKDFLRMHFELQVVIIYSTSGYGSHGTRKKKFDSNTLILYVYECFNRSFPNLHSFQEVNKAIVQFWGRAPDMFNKITERAMKREYI